MLQTNQKKKNQSTQEEQGKQDDNTVKASELQNVDSTFMESRSISPQETIDTTSTLIESAPMTRNVSTNIKSPTLETMSTCSSSSASSQVIAHPTPKRAYQPADSTVLLLLLTKKIILIILKLEFISRFYTNESIARIL